jgi:sugar lactone lactonase YvrE
MRSTEAAVLHSPTSDADRFLPEGPRIVTVESRTALAWVNIQTATDSTVGDVHVRFLNGEHRTYRQPRRPGFLFPTDRPDTLFVGMEKDVGLLNLVTNTFTSLATIPDANPRTIVNDGEIVPGGRAVVFGTKDVRFADPIAHLYLFTLDGRLTTLADGQMCSNGKVFDGPTLYDIDTPRRNVIRYRLDLDGRRLHEEGVALDLASPAGFPDGMCDAGGDTVVIAFYNPDPVPQGRAIRFDLRTGEAIEEWTTSGSPRVTCPLLAAWGGRTKLVLTTAVEGMPNEMREKCPNAGSLFIADTDLSLQTIEIVRLG